VRAASFNADLAASVAGQQEAARLGVAPAILASAPEGHFLSDVIAGVTLRPAIIRANGNAPAVVAALRKLHGGRMSARTFDIFEGHPGVAPWPDRLLPLRCWGEAGIGRPA
jgi:hypothetical protein